MPWLGKGNKFPLFPPSRNVRTKLRGKGKSAAREKQTKSEKIAKLDLDAKNHVSLTNAEM